VADLKTINYFCACLQMHRMWGGKQSKCTSYLNGI
jgi:hypothetical protein